MIDNSFDNKYNISKKFAMAHRTLAKDEKLGLKSGTLKSDNRR